MDVNLQDSHIKGYHLLSAYSVWTSLSFPFLTTNHGLVSRITLSTGEEIQARGQVQGTVNGKAKFLTQVVWSQSPAYQQAILLYLQTPSENRKEHEFTECPDITRGLENSRALLVTHVYGKLSVPPSQRLGHYPCCSMPTPSWHGTVQDQVKKQDRILPKHRGIRPASNNEFIANKTR